VPPEGAWSQQAMQSMTANMQGIKRMAESGGFAISQEGADQYLKAIREALLDLQDMESELMEVQQQTKLGTSPDATAMSRYNRENAMGGGGTLGIVPAVEQLRAALKDAEAAMVKAVQNYRSADEGSQNAFRGY
jgi:hypothetical protein